MIYQHYLQTQPSLNYSHYHPTSAIHTWHQAAAFVFSQDDLIFSRPSLVAMACSIGRLPTAEPIESKLVNMLRKNDNIVAAPVNRKWQKCRSACQRVKHILIVPQYLNSNHVTYYVITCKSAFDWVYAEQWYVIITSDVTWTEWVSEWVSESQIKLPELESKLVVHSSITLFRH